MTRKSTITLALSALLVAGPAVAQTTTPPPQTTPPPTQTPPAKPPAAQTPAKPADQKPAPLKPPTEPFPADAKVGYVDLQLVVAQSKLGQAGHDQMTALNDKLSAALTAKNKEIQALQDKIKAQQNLVADAILQGMTRDLDKLQRDTQYMGQDSQVQINQLNEQLLANFQAKVLPIVEEIRKEKGLWIIFALGDNSNIAAANAALDLSFEVIKRLDATVK
ncbi:MAG TPA: OmpH family outer membrane protein [Vicinamibacterales bacterium]|nr:OmpH family outer membrane protein [Vicinamibacterales bacterium]